MNQNQAKQAAPLVDRPTNATVETEVLIVGGSLVGLTMALACQRQGIRVLLAEKHAESSVHPRASRYNARAMEVFRALGVEFDVRAAGADLENAMGSLSGPTLLQALAGRPANHADIHGRMRAVEEELSPAPSGRAPQNRVEPVLRAVGEARGGDLRFSSEVVELTQTPSSVTARILHRETGASQLVRARYAVVADGAAGKMRERLGIGREHLGVAARYVNILFDADLRSFLAGREFNTCFLQRPDYTALLHAFDQGRRWRLQLVVPHADQGTLEPPSRDRCVEIVRAGMGIPDLTPNIIDAQRWEAASAMALAYRSGRVLLAGDAAHQMTPFLGLGAATGIEDANNLAWKLAFVLRGLAGDGLLDTYEAERLPVARQAVIASSRAADENGLPRLGRSGPPTDVRTLLSLDYAYRSRAIASDDEVNPEDEGQPGRRVPHAWLRARDGSRVSTLDLAPGELVLLSGPHGSSWKETAERLSSPVSVSIQAFCIGGEDLAEETGRWWTRAGIGRDGALLVRPDGVVAWRSPGAVAEPATVRDILGKILGEVSPLERPYPEQKAPLD